MLAGGEWETEKEKERKGSCPFRERKMRAFEIFAEYPLYVEGLSTGPSNLFPSDVSGARE
jgi:hypothetical protein